MEAETKWCFSDVDSDRSSNGPGGTFFYRAVYLKTRMSPARALFMSAVELEPSVV